MIRLIGTNTFSGTIETPNDGSDSFVFSTLLPNYQVTGIRFTYTDVDPFWQDQGVSVAVTGGSINAFGTQSLNEDYTSSPKTGVSNVNFQVAGGFVFPEAPWNLEIDVIECFLTGTKILTSQREVAVERLTIGDRVRTAEGNLETIKWIGRQTVDPQAPHHPFRSLPIQIKAGALGDNVPVRDLFVSPDHALLVKGLLVNAGALENGVSIIRTQPEEIFTYHHIELENHALLIAEGAYAESYLPQNQARETFDNSDEYAVIYPDDKFVSLISMGFPRVSSKRQLPRSVKNYLLEAAHSLQGLTVGAIA